MSYLYAHDNPFTSREAMLNFADFITDKIGIARRCKRSEYAQARACSGILEKDFFYGQAFAFKCEENALREIWRNFLNSLDDYAKFDIFAHFAQGRFHVDLRTEISTEISDCPF